MKKLKDMDIQFVLADECQYIKDSRTKRAKAVYNLNSAKFCIGATATPIQKNPQDIYGIFKFIDPKVFGNKTLFNSQFVRFGTFNQVIGAKNEGLLNQKIAPYMIVKTKHEIASQLPKLSVIQKYCSFSSKQEKKNELLMSQLEDLRAQQEDNAAKLKGKEVDPTSELGKTIKQLDAQIMAIQTYAQELADSEKLLEMSNSKAAKVYATGDPDPKLALLMDLLAEITSSGEKVIVFSKYVRMQEIITDAINANKDINSKIAYCRGDMSAEQRYDEIYRKFQGDDPDYKILLMSDAGAEGVNASKCSYIIEYEPANSYALQTQRHGRIERADSVSDTSTVYQLLVDNSWDIIAQSIVTKKQGYDSRIVKGKG